MMEENLGMLDIKNMSFLACIKKSSAPPNFCICEHKKIVLPDFSCSATTLVRQPFFISSRSSAFNAPQVLGLENFFLNYNKIV